MAFNTTFRILALITIVITTAYAFNIYGKTHSGRVVSTQRKTNRLLDPSRFNNNDILITHKQRINGLFMTSSTTRNVLSSSGTFKYTGTPLTQHSQLVKGKLSNGFTYVILPNANPVGRFEAHLEVLSGSVHELEPQQGMAHLLEHIAYMGSPNRAKLSGTGSKTNAYTDFHHTVFFATCPTESPDIFFKKPMLPMALNALLDVMTTNVDDSRLEQERAAVLSEASMVNKMEYRVECQVLSALHTENRISSRFPIGHIDKIKKWTKQEVQLYHSTHYTPENVILYVVGDVDVKSTVETIEQKFGHLKPKFDTVKLLKESGEFPDISMNIINRHFPPVVHKWSCPEDVVSNHVPKELIRPVSLGSRDADRPAINDGFLPQPKIFKHELMQSFSFHLFAKRPIEPVVTTQSLKREIMRRITLSALQIRFNVQQRQDPLFTFVDFNQLNWPREGCAVCSLDLTTDVTSWKEAVETAVMEVRRLGIYGLTQSELARYKQAVLSDADQALAQSDQVLNEDILLDLMESTACGHTFMHPSLRLEATKQALDDITVEDINGIAKELCEHLSDIRPEDGVAPAAIVACTPLLDRSNERFHITEQDVSDVIMQALTIPLDALVEQEVPVTLVTKAELNAKILQTKPQWVPADGKAMESMKAAAKLGVSHKKLSNGLRVNIKSIDAEPQCASVRLYVPGGRMLETKPGAVLVGSRTIQEGGAFLSVTREEVELFCIDHLVTVDIIATEDALIFDFQSVTSPSAPGDDNVNGLEAVMQVVHIILTDFKYEEDAFERAKQGMHAQYDSCMKGLESACLESITYALSGGDGRFVLPDHESIDELDLPTVKEAIVNQLGPEAVEVSIAGDASMSVLESLALNYLGTVPPRSIKRSVEEVVDSITSINSISEPQDLKVYLQDSDERAMGYVMGTCPNRWGVFADGSTLADKLNMLSNRVEDRRKHPLFGNVALLLFQEIANRRLFSVVREERRLTYDASFSLTGTDGFKGGWYITSVTSSPQQVAEAVSACKDALQSLNGSDGIQKESLKSVKRTLLNRYFTECTTNKFWVEAMSGTQLESSPYKSMSCIADFESVVESVSIQDIQLIASIFEFNKDHMNTCIGVAAPTM